jgi:hypothetical protein
MKIDLRLAVALFTFPSLVLSCVGDTPAPPRQEVIPIGSTPPGRPSGPVNTNPGNVPPVATAGTGGGGAGGAGGGAPPRPVDARPVDAPGADTPPAAVCTMTVPAMGNDGLIDDFNDNNVELRMADGRMGAWSTLASPTAMVTNQMMAGVPELATIMGTNRGLRFRGTEPNATSQWAGQVEVGLVADCYDASVYRGLELQIRGLANSRVQVMVLTASVRAQNAIEPVGGHYNFPVTLTAAFQTVRILWDQFLPGWGTTPGPKIDPKLVYGLAILPAERPPTGDASAGSIGAFDFTIDNVRFIAPM